MPTPRKPTVPTAEAIDQFCASFDALFPRREERQACKRHPVHWSCRAYSLLDNLLI